MHEHGPGATDKRTTLLLIVPVPWNPTGFVALSGPVQPTCQLQGQQAVLPLLLPVVALALPAPQAPLVATAGDGAPSPAPAAGSRFSLEFQRGKGQHASGDALWWLELKRNGTTVARWPAASGIASRQRADRRWSPGNGAPLPPGVYRLGRPEAWAGSFWISLQPRFPTSRSALGIHTCLPGTGCICLPNPSDTAAVTRWIRNTGLTQLTVVD